jgi:hypothetical protein
MKKTVPGLSLLSLLTWNCSTELDVNAPYKEITIVYATLSTTKPDGLTPETTHFVKINRAFQGDGAALVYAAIPDSNEYTQDQLVDARVEEWDGNNNLVNTFLLNDTTIPDRLPGTFYYPQQTVYYFNATLNEDHDYRFAAIVKGKEVSGATPIVDNFPVHSTIQSSTFRPNFYDGNGYRDVEVKWTSDKDGRRYELYYTFYYNEVTATGSEEKSFTQLVASVVTVDDGGGQQLSAAIVGEDFYRTIEARVPIDPNVVRREFHGIRFHWAVASDDFHTFLLLHEPITGIVEDRPDFTNLQNGYGIFVSRYFEMAPGTTNIENSTYRILTGSSLVELASGTYTGQLGFCSPYVVHNGEPYGCN